LTETTVVERRAMANARAICGQRRPLMGSLPLAVMRRRKKLSSSGQCFFSDPH